MSKQDAVLEPTVSDPVNVFPVLGAFNGAMSEALNRCAMDVAKGVADWQQETTRFVQERLNHNLSTAQTAAKCTTLEDWFSVQQSWASKAATAYIEELKRLQQLTTQAAQATMAFTSPTAGNGPRP